ncbi:hypothetical protein [Streptomyces clavifer]|uniref:hypothetical protein n=1 Tax=Streptomyces clavifer TaxID=68188 RepID=UPI003090BAD1|nr:hypothetical protein OG388_11500 [Streptomyces clavifer]
MTGPAVTALRTRCIRTTGGALFVVGAGAGDCEVRGAALRTPGRAGAPGTAARCTAAGEAPGTGAAARRRGAAAGALPTAAGAAGPVLTGDGVNPAAVTGRADPTSGATGMASDFGTGGASAGGAGTAEGTEAADDRCTGGRDLVGAARVREGRVAAGIRCGIPGAGWARGDRCTGGAPPGRPGPGASSAKGRTGRRLAEPVPAAGPPPDAGSDRVGLTGGTAEAAPGRRTGTAGSAARCTGTAAVGRAAPDPLVDTGRVELVVGASLFAPSPAEPLVSRTAAPGTVAPEAAAGPPATGPERRTAAEGAGSEGAPVRGPGAGTRPAAGSRRTDGSPVGRGPPPKPLGVRTAPGPADPGAASRCTGGEPTALPAVVPDTTAEFARVGTTGAPVVPGPATTPLARVPETEEPEETEGPEVLGRPGPGTGPVPVLVGRCPLDDAPSATARRCTGNAGAEAEGGATGPGAGRAGGAGRALGRPPAADERCTWGA